MKCGGRKSPGRDSRSARRPSTSPVRKLTDEQMLKIMANENGEEWGGALVVAPDEPDGAVDHALAQVKTQGGARHIDLGDHLGP